MEQSKFYQIKNITEHEYTLVGCDGSVITRPIQDVDNSALAFTIQDAKNGDVLAVKGERAFIFKGFTDVVNPNCPVAHCGIDTNNNLYISDNNHWTTCKVTPSTKEQRDLLFQKMKEAGYEWDAKKKELKKIEQKPVEPTDLRTWKYIVDAVLTEREGIGQYIDSPWTTEVAEKLQKRFGNIEQKPVEDVNGEDYGIDGLYIAMDILNKTLRQVEGYQSDDGILEHKAAMTAVKKLYKQKPAWSEEDEKQARQIERIVHDAGCTQRLQKQIADWLKSLKDRYTWKPSESDILLLERIANGKSNPQDFQASLGVLIGQLKKLREK